MRIQKVRNCTIILCYVIFIKLLFHFTFKIKLTTIHFKTYIIIIIYML
jgi:hypothetical protein